MALIEHDLFQRLCRARELLAAEHAEPLSVRAVADAVAVSQYHFIRRFEQLFGATPGQFRLRARIERAKELLARGEHSVTENCMEVGFTSLGSFSTRFRARVGVMPSAYRREKRVLVQVRGVLPPELAPGCLSLMARLPSSAFRNSREA
jgi:AraC-like DNA-binding protein